jgi:hypothetical protein
MKTYSDSHWVTDEAVNGKTSIEIMEAITSDLSQAKEVITQLFAWYLVEGTTSDRLEGVEEILNDIFDMPHESKEGAQYRKAQVRSSYVLALAANDLNRFMSEAVSVMLSHIEEHGFAGESSE